MKMSVTPLVSSHSDRGTDTTPLLSLQSRTPSSPQEAPVLGRTLNMVTGPHTLVKLWRWLSVCNLWQVGFKNKGTLFQGKVSSKWREGKTKQNTHKVPDLSLIHISEPTRPPVASRMPSSA